MKIILCAFLTAFAPSTFGQSGFPNRISISELNEDAYFRAFGQYIQKENGDFTSEFGRVLIFESADSFEIAFYEKEGDDFVRLGFPVAFQDTRSPHVSAMNNLGVPCIRARKKDDSGVLNAYVPRGIVTMSESEE